jgi:Domain of unknown function (DUF1844)
MAEDHPLLPATFEFLVISLKTQVEISLGLVKMDEEEEREPNFRVARHAIDTMSMLQDKTKGNLSWDEERLLHNALTELRFRFVQVFEMSKTATAQAAAGEQAAG